ncbi:MAG: nucleotidyltransferase family protein [Hyphomicrobiaceae bacterium]|nr:nucleotidyltransferase family protein [Hyphomicrobiaceae bacterium]
MSAIEPHRALSREGARLLISIADPAGRAPSPSLAPDPARIELVLAAAENHGVLPAAIRALSRLVRGGGGEPARSSGSAAAAAGSAALDAARLKLAYQTGFQMMLSHHAGRVMAAFASAGIPGAIVKGAAFARRLYPEPSLRTFTDVDVLIAEPDRSRTAGSMRALGFELFEFADRQGKDYHEQKWLLSAQPDVLVELHTNLVHSPKLRGAMSIGYVDVLEAGDGDSADATALLLVAAAHGAVGHQLDRLQHLVDVTQAARGVAGPIDADRLARVSERCGVTLAITGALQLAGRTFGEPRCLGLAKRLMPSPIARLPGRLLSPGLVVRGQSRGRTRGSWRRKLFRQALRFG